MTDTSSAGDVPYIRKVLRDMPRKFDPPTVGFLRHGGVDVDKLRLMGLNESIFPPSETALEAIRDTLGMVNRYPDAQCPRLSDKVRELTGIGAERIVWGNGTEELIRGTIDLAVPRGGSVVINVPTFWGYRAMLRAAETRPLFVPVLADGRPDILAMVAAIEPDTRMVCLVTPNNPTGSITAADDFRALAAAVPTDVLLFVDEAYYEFARFAGGPDIVSLLNERDGPWMLVRSFSKAYSMAGLRIGYALCSDERIADALRKTTSVFNVPLLAQVAAEAAFEDTAYLDGVLSYYRDAREEFASGLESLGLRPLPSVANFVSFEIEGMNNRLAHDGLMQMGIQIHAWPDPGYENFLRITIGSREDNAACLEALSSLIGNRAQTVRPA